MVLYLEVVVRRCSSKLVFLKGSQISQENTCVGVSFFSACNFINKRLQNRCFPVKCTKFLRTPFYLFEVAYRVCHGIGEVFKLQDDQEKKKENLYRLLITSIF